VVVVAFSNSSIRSVAGRGGRVEAAAFRDWKKLAALGVLFPSYVSRARSLQADGSHAGDVLRVCRWISKERITGHVHIAHVCGRYTSNFLPALPLLPRFTLSLPYNSLVLKYLI
jgi:hypothetical protein